MCADLTINQQMQQLAMDIATTTRDLELFEQAKTIPSYLRRLSLDVPGIRGDQYYRTDVMSAPGACNLLASSNPVDLIRQRLQELQYQSKNLNQQVSALFRSLDPRKILTGATGVTTAAASSWTILNTPLGALAGSIGLGATTLLGIGAAVVSGVAGVGIGYGIHRGLKAVQGRSLGALYYDNDVLSARSFAQWTTEHELLDMSSWGWL